MQTDVYKTVKGWSGRRYRVQMTEAEIHQREMTRLVLSIALGVPFYVLIAAKVVGLI